MGWTFDWVSSGNSDFNYVSGVSFKKDDIEAGRAIYNYGTPVKKSEDLHGTSIFVKDDCGATYHTCSIFGRGSELSLGAFMWLDLTPKGRNESGTMSWVGGTTNTLTLRQIEPVAVGKLERQTVRTT
jgi:predicted dithiol-disulfide oxidoreductase (DUF899 family)